MSGPLWLAAGALLAGAALVGRRGVPPRGARRAAVVAAAAAIGPAAAAWPLRPVAPGLAGGTAAALLGTAAAVATLLAVGLAPVSSHPPAVLRRVLELGALTLAGLAAGTPLAVAAGFAATAWLVGRPLRRAAAGPADGPVGQPPVAAGLPGSFPGGGAANFGGAAAVRPPASGTVAARSAGPSAAGAAVPAAARAGSSAAGVGEPAGGPGIGGSGGPAFAVGRWLAVGLVAAGVLVPGGVGGGLLAAAVLLRLGAPPGHGWLPPLVQRAPLGLVAAWLASALPGLLLVAAHPPPGAAWWLVGGGLGAVAVALRAVVADDARRALAYLLAGEAAAVAAAFGAGPGAALVAGAAGVVGGAATLMAAAALAGRRGALRLRDGGAYARTPRLAVGFLLAGLAVAGCPPLLGGLADELTLRGARPAYAIPLVLAAAVQAVAVLRLYFGLFTGVRAHDGQRDLTGREVFALTVGLAALLLAVALPVPL
ncbi:hypothetical protein GCM10010123_37000 [Pilimelia anulata]|uniref:NADH:quinone oxidoreductase/Mrp antiporter transmembrane domain-containing protein n=1 Tax=Pilimelia anulata TaxID=53371 RepID=A0A8J3B9X3_9ACTN|nr:proton-conducting transporter membrane subunit [Pilimelia anulata]GGK03648.1 hypothetical protein GCM10010123_37000 [Pilimelia anulata]